MSRSERAYQRNAADPLQGALAERIEQDRIDARASCLKAVMQTPEGRRLIAELTPDVSRTVYDHSGSAMYFNEGRRCHQLEWLGYAEDADPKMFLLMQQEMQQLRERIWREVTASRTRRAQPANEVQHGS